MDDQQNSSIPQSNPPSGLGDVQPSGQAVGQTTDTTTQVQQPSQGTGDSSAPVSPPASMTSASVSIPSPGASLDPQAPSDSQTGIAQPDVMGVPAPDPVSTETDSGFATQPVEQSTLSMETAPVTPPVPTTDTTVPTADTPAADPTPFPAISTSPPAPEQQSGAPDAPIPPVPSQPGDVVTTETGQKKRFSKVYLLVIVIALVLGGLGFLLWRFWPSGFLGLGTKGEIVWWGLWEEELIVAPLIAEYQAANPGVTISYVKQSPQDYRERLTNSLARGEGPDIFRFHNTWVPMFKNELDVIPSEIMSPEEFSSSYYPVIISDLTSGSGLVGVPLGYDALTLFINEDLFAVSGKTPPETWDDFRALAQELTVREENGSIIQSGAAIGRIENVDHWQEILGLMMLQNGVDMANPSDQRANDALTFYTLFSKTDNVWDQTLPPSTIAFANGKAAMYFGPSWRAFEIQQLNPDLRFRTATLPQLPKDNPNDPSTGYATYWVEGVWKRSANKNEAWKFVRFISSRDSLEKLYQNASATRLFGEPYPRVDMAPLLTSHPIAGSVINLAPEAKSWYLVSRTFDGTTGLNSQINQYFADAMNASTARGVKTETLETLASGVAQVLSQYGLFSR